MSRREEIETRLKAIDHRQAQIERDANALNDGKFSESARQEYQSLRSEFDRLSAELKTLPGTPLPRKSHPDSASPFRGAADQSFNGPAIRQPGSTRETWIDASTGADVPVFGPTDRLSADDDGLSLGKYLRGIGCGNWRGAERERVLALSEGGAGGGSFIVPEEFSQEWIDKARAKSVMIAAGTRTIEMGSETLYLARVDTDPTAYVTPEDQSITESDIQLGSVLLTARKLAILVRASREILQDAPNAPALIEQVMARALATELDRLMLLGTHGNGITGVIGHSGVTTNGSIGAIAMEDFITCATDVRGYNFEPTAVILHPTIWSDAMALTTGDAVNSSKNWLELPPHVRNIPFLQTTAATTAYAVCGDFTHAVLGVRSGTTIETSPVADTAFVKHQVLFKAVTRVAFVLTRPTAFSVLSGITT